MTADAELCGLIGLLAMVCYSFSVTNNLGGANRIYQFSAFVLAATIIDDRAPTGFEADFEFVLLGGAWTDDDYNSAIAPGETGFFSFFTFDIYPQPSAEWSVSVEAGPNGEDTEFFQGTVATIPEPSTWAMLLVGFAWLGLRGLSEVAQDWLHRLKSAARMPPLAALRQPQDHIAVALARFHNHEIVDCPLFCDPDDVRGNRDGKCVSAALELSSHHAHWIGFLAGLIGFCGGGVLLLLKYEGYEGPR